EAKEADAEGRRAFAHLGEMPVHLAAGLVQRGERRAGQLELAARLERDGAEADRVGEADDAAGVHDRLPAEKAGHEFEQAADAVLALIGNRAEILAIEAELLVL